MDDLAIYIIRSNMTDLVRVAVYNKKEKKIAEDIFGSDVYISKIEIKGIPTELATKTIQRVIYEKKFDTKMYSCDSDPYATLYLDKENYNLFVSYLDTYVSSAIDEYSRTIQ